MNESATVSDDVTDRPSASTRRPLPPGTWLDEFEVGEVIAQGSASIVYAATDDTLAVPVVIAEYMPAQLAQRGDDLRVLPSSPANDGVFALGLRAFIADSRVLARCDHPSLVRILRLRESNATAYRVMPRYTASSLLDVRRGMREPPDEQSLRNLLDALLGALDAFHRAGGFHGKVTPSNILLLGNDRPLLLSSGSAGRAIAGELLAPEAISAPSFAPIEQLVESPDMPLGPSADLYALAGVARYWISGDLPPPAVGAPGSARRETLDAMVERLQQRWPHVRYAPWLIDALDGAWSIYRAGRPQSVTEMRVRMNAALQDDLGRVDALVPAIAGRRGADMEAQVADAVAAADDVPSARLPPAATSTPPSRDPAMIPLNDAVSDPEFEHRSADSSADALSRATRAEEAVASSASDLAAHIDDPVVVDVPLDPEDFARLDIRADPVAVDAVAFDVPDSLVFDAPDGERFERLPRQRSGVARTLLWMFAIFALLALAAGGVYVLNKQHRLDRVLDVLGISHPSSARTPPEPTAKDVRAPAVVAPAPTSPAPTAAVPPTAPATAVPPTASTPPSATPSGAAAPPPASAATTGGAVVSSPAAATSAGGGTAANPVESPPAAPTLPAVAPAVIAPVPVPAAVNPGQTAAPNAQAAPADQPAGTSNTQANTQANTQVNTQPNPQPNVQPPPAARASSVAPSRPTRHPSEARPAAPAPRAAAREAPSPRDACGGRTEFALYRCMQTQCGSPQWASHSQCERLRQTDRVE